MKTINPWVEHICSLMDPALLASKLSFEIAPLVGLEKLDAEVAAIELRERLGAHYVPSEQSVAVARKVLATALSHARRAYPDVATYINHSTMAAVPGDDDPPTWLITGLAGVGKSALLVRLARLFDSPPVFQASVHCPPRSILGGIFLKITGKVTKAEIFRALARRLGIEIGETDRVGTSTLQAIRNELYRQGCMFILADESQSLGSSKGAGAIFVNFIALLRKFGLPVIVVGNYSMVHGIFKQPSQHRHRILDDPSVMLPDGAGDMHFVRQIQAYTKLCPAFTFDPVADSPRIHFFTGGCSRALLKLLAVAYRDQRSVPGNEQVSLAALEAAYDSIAFVMHREEIETLREHRLTGKRIREDLMNPFEMAGPVAAQEKRRLAKLHRESVAAAVARTAQAAPPASVKVESGPAEPARQDSQVHLDEERAQVSRSKVATQPRVRRPPPSIDDAMRGWA